MATHIGKSRQTLYNYLDNLSQPDKDTALKIAQYLGVTMDELFILDTQDHGRTDSSVREAEHGAEKDTERTLRSGDQRKR